MQLLQRRKSSSRHRKHSPIKFHNTPPSQAAANKIYPSDANVPGSLPITIQGGSFISTAPVVRALKPYHAEGRFGTFQIVGSAPNQTPSDCSTNDYSHGDSSISTESVSDSLIDFQVALSQLCRRQNTDQWKATGGLSAVLRRPTSEDRGGSEGRKEGQGQITVSRTSANLIKSAKLYLNSPQSPSLDIPSMGSTPSTATGQSKGHNISANQNGDGGMSVVATRCTPTHKAQPLLQPHLPPSVPSLHLSKAARTPHRGSKGNRSLSQDAAMNKITRVYLSEAHSKAYSDQGDRILGAPPATPTSYQLSKVEYVASLTDIRAQRDLKEKLTGFQNKKKSSEAKKKVVDEKHSKAEEMERLKEFKRNQRNIIYALNAIMTDAENAKFVTFVKEYGLKS